MSSDPNKTGFLFFCLWILITLMHALQVVDKWKGWEEYTRLFPVVIFLMLIGIIYAQLFLWSTFQIDSSYKNIFHICISPQVMNAVSSKVHDLKV